MLDLGGKVSTKKLRSYQQNAIDAWIANGHQGILEMATGTGKTFTASQCIGLFQEQFTSTVTVVIAPSQSIASQWLENLGAFDPIAIYKEKSWQTRIKDLLPDLRMGLRQHTVLIVIQNTACKPAFRDLIEPLLEFAQSSLLVADEAHGLGSEVFRNALLPAYQGRLALSATPSRWFDEEGTEFITDYFKDVVFVFGIHEALNWIDPDTGETPLCPYMYFPTFVGLDTDELEEYVTINSAVVEKFRKGVKVRKLKSWEDDPDVQQLLDLLIERAGILKSAAQKIDALRNILLSQQTIQGCLIYCSDRNQIEEVIPVLRELGITYRPFTGEEGTSPLREFKGKSERDIILEEFEAGRIQVLVAMKCLDEGIDVPSAKLGIILASTTNPREFIQRRGRLLRRSPGKKEAKIYDLVVSPSSVLDQGDLYEHVVKKITYKELVRVEAFSEDAINSNHASAQILEQLINVGVRH
jgi:superfamily II DNA or RNA helicase